MIYLINSSLSKKDLNVIFVGFGSACVAITKLLEIRNTSSQNRVSSVIYIPGMLDVPRILKLYKDWYENVSRFKYHDKSLIVNLLENTCGHTKNT